MSGPSRLPPGPRAFRANLRPVHTAATVLVGAVLSLSALGVLAAPPAVAQGVCAAAIDRQDASAATDPGLAIRLDGNRNAVLTLISNEPQGAVTVRIDYGPSSFPVTVQGTQLRPGVWAGVLRVADFARYGVGLYHVTAEGQGCSIQAWITVTDRSPFTTAAGIGGAIAVGIGLILLVVAFVKGSVIAGVAGGAIAGLGANVLTQQFGVTPVTGKSVAIWVVVPGTAGGLMSAAVVAVRKPRAAPDISEDAPPGTDAAPPPGTEAEPPVPGAAPPPGGGGDHAEPPAGDAADPPRTSFALLRSPEAVVAGVEFGIEVGLSPQPEPGVVADPLVRPPSSTGPYTLSVQIVAEGFSLRPGEDWRQEMRVTADAPYPQVSLKLTADVPAQPIHATAIRAIYAADGQTMGFAVRPIAVVRTAELAASVAATPPEPGEDVNVPANRVAPDLTIHVLRSTDGSASRLLWTMAVPATSKVQPPTEALSQDIGSAPDAFAKRLMNGVNAREGQNGLYQYLVGVGRSIADAVPQGVFDVLSAVGAEVGGPPTVMLYSEEPYVPWELAVLDAPIDPAGPPFLAAQANMGRWALGHRRPPVPPPVSLSVGAVAVVSGVYDRPGWRRLVEAEAEAAEIATTYGGVQVNADTADVLGCIEGTPPADVLHFAVHGSYDPTGTQDGLVLVDGGILDPLEVRGVNMPRPAFVFLNACQVGEGNQLLGDYAGMAEAFLYAGASAVVAPLWSVKDSVAKEIAVGFYQGVFAGASPAQMLRTARAKFVRADEPVSATYLAYQFFGDPTLRLTRTAGAPPDPVPAHDGGSGG